MKFLRILPAYLFVLALTACGGEGGGADGHSADGAPVDEAAEEAVEVRESVLILLKNNYLPLGGMARGKVPFDIDAVRKNSMRIGQLARMLGDTFIYDTRGSGVHTEALDNIWTDTELFAEKLGNLVSAADALEGAAQGSDQAAINEAIGNVGKACGGCHDNFREDDD